MENSPESRIHFLDYWRIIRSRLGLVILVFILVVSTDGVVTYFTPNMTPVRIFDEQAGSVDNAGRDQRFIPTQFQIISRKVVLYPVIDQVDLQKKWNVKGE